MKTLVMAIFATIPLQLVDDNTANGKSVMMDKERF
jgi:hypothetical protein